MTDPSYSSLFTQHRRANWIRLRTLVVLRWIAIGGQLTAIVVARRLFELELALGLCFLAVGISVVMNLVALAIYPENKRLTEGEVTGMLLFDILQLSFLLFLTGGLNNPFALLILVPVTISATALRWQTTALLGGTAVTLVTAVTFWHVPLHTPEGAIMRMPEMFVIGFWLAIVIGAGFLGAFAQRITSEIATMSDALVATQMALAREQKLTDLGGVVAAAAHELGTPLATIKLVSAELMEDLEGDQREDARLIREQADRCRDILQSMGRIGKDDLHLRFAPLEAVLREAAEPHAGRGKEVRHAIVGEGSALTIQRRPEIIHGLRNLVQNAVDFARSTVWIEGGWTEDRIFVRIADDGPGFPTSVLGRIGDPFVRRRRVEDDRRARPEYEGMGLGLFIAKTLLERSGAELSFANGSGALAPQTGAIVVVSWRRNVIDAQVSGPRAALGHNVPIEV
ncbi:sensor histidine kinase RegB [Roseitranquillus sediminis]|uniref:sensor histidine kinase RegB n=1 Tax=Roseitranquillus sediminis TaxID=2809051 RepID=UPI001D0CC377|nr:ActS/PrrB/RegB family redox-sensitive histidine kinase [Roseitranquillus sediminis]MBM9596258.1 ActS/PrrB/RegB family redox-sensitive histidine kinase [Roseitranquillus sediminis]